MPYLNDMPSALAVADLVISRAGGHGSGRDNCAGGSAGFTDSISQCGL